jgi:phosphoribosylglycinamide formyltransferase-1
MINAAIFASGEGTNAENLFKYFLNDARIKIKLVITNNETAGIVARAEKYKKNIHIVSKSALENYSDQLIEFLKVENIDLIILAGFLLKLPEKFVHAFPNKIINIHPALLPNYGGKGMHGMHVHEAVIKNKDTVSGISIHFVNEEYDKGEIILQAKCEVDKNDTAEDLAKKVQELEYQYLPTAIESFL